MSYFAGYSFINLPIETLRSSPAFQARDAAFFKQNPQRSYHLRPAYDGEANEFEDSDLVWAIVYKSFEGQLDYRAVSLDGQSPDDTEVNGRWMWQIWETDYTGEVEFYDYEISLLERVFQNLNRPSDSAA